MLVCTPAHETTMSPAHLRSGDVRRLSIVRSVDSPAQCPSGLRPFLWLLRGPDSTEGATVPRGGWFMK